MNGSRSRLTLDSSFRQPAALAQPGKAQRCRVGKHRYNQNDTDLKEEVVAVV